MRQIVGAEMSEGQSAIANAYYDHVARKAKKVLRRARQEGLSREIVSQPLIFDLLQLATEIAVLGSVEAGENPDGAELTSAVSFHFGEAIKAVDLYRSLPQGAA